MKRVSYSQLKNLLCPVRQYLSLANKRHNVTKSVLSGVVVHAAYNDAITTGDFEFFDDVYVDAVLRKKKYRHFLKQPLYIFTSSVKKNLHIGFIKTLPDVSEAEKVISAKVPASNILPSLEVFGKPDIYYIKNHVATIIEIKTGRHGKFDAVQLLFYAWCISNKYPEVTDFKIKVFNTHDNVCETIDTYTKQYVSDMISLHMSSTDKAYTLLGIHSIPEVAPTVKCVINAQSQLLPQVMQHISSEQCEACPHMTSCPVYLQEMLRVFVEKTSNEPSSNILSYYASMISVSSARKIITQ